jgi:hypothetical protein
MLRRNHLVVLERDLLHVQALAAVDVELEQEDVAVEVELRARAASGWPERCQLAHAFLWGHG